MLFYLLSVCNWQWKQQFLGCVLLLLQRVALKGVLKTVKTPWDFTKVRGALSTSLPAPAVLSDSPWKRTLSSGSKSIPTERPRAGAPHPGALDQGCRGRASRCCRACRPVLLRPTKRAWSTRPSYTLTGQRLVFQETTDRQNLLRLLG